MYEYLFHETIFNWINKKWNKYSLIYETWESFATFLKFIKSLLPKYWSLYRRFKF